uniref:Serine peptidase inhibitor, Kunitz type 4 n=1 Tax=Pipistrellus kuhlii TaxID=59472 RepID=A0A7J7YBB7_PIPKU|nr:serine peptidase inhibitor, Kunitz type 4 [Pipistrellus kuhlii]
MKPAELRFLLKLFLFALLATPVMGGVKSISKMLCGEYGEPCGMDPSPGSCYEIYFRYFYNKTAERCQSFIFTGCDGNLNNYQLKIDCQVACEKEYKIP